MCGYVVCVCVLAHIWNEIDKRKMTDAILQSLLNGSMALENQ